MLQTKYLIVGCSHAGLSALEAIRLQDETSAITMVSREPTLPYSPTILPYIICGQKQKDQIHLRDRTFFDDLNVSFMPGCTVTGVNASEKTAVLDSGEKIEYEKLLLASGADATIPPFPGVETVSYQVVRTLDDALKLRKSIKKAKSAVVIGAGLIAMHTAENLAQAGLVVTMVVRRKVSLFSYFDGEAAQMIEKIFAQKGVTIATGSGVARMEAANGGCEITLESDKVLPADLLLLTTGVRPRIGYLAGSEIETDQGILVDESMRTSAQDIWAAGDVAQAPGFFNRTDLVTPAGQNLVGISLVSHVPDNPIMGCFKTVVQGHREFNTTQACAEMTTGGRNSLEQIFTQFIGKLWQLVFIQLA